MKTIERETTVVDNYFSKLGLEASKSMEEFLEILYLHHGSMAAEFDEAIAGRGRENQDTMYFLKNKSLDFGLDVARMLCDFYKSYANWFVSLNRPQPRRLLDIGCDNGILTCFYAYLYPDTEIIGIDKNEAGIRCAEELARRLGLTNVSFHQIDLTELHTYYPEGCFDIVTSVRCLHEVMGTIPVPIYWSLPDYLEMLPVNTDPHSISIIEKVLSENGEYISAERLENPAAVGQWANLLEMASLSVDWASSGLIEFHETGQHQKMPAIVANKKDSRLTTLEGLRTFYTRNQQLDPESKGSYRSVAAEIMFNDFTQKELMNGYLLDFNDHWYKMRFEIWSTETFFLVYGSGNMGYRQLELVVSFYEAQKKLHEILNQYSEHGEVYHYTTIKERDNL